MHQDSSKNPTALYSSPVCHRTPDLPSTLSPAHPWSHAPCFHMDSSWFLCGVGQSTYLFISPLPEAAHNEDHSHGWLQVGADGLDVDKKLASLADLDHRDPENGDHHQ